MKTSKNSACAQNRKRNISKELFQRQYSLVSHFPYTKRFRLFRPHGQSFLFDCNHQLVNTYDLLKLGT